MAGKWESAVENISSEIFKIDTHSGSGTGFVLTLNGPSANKFYGLATAYHVIGSANELELPIKLTHVQTNTSVVLKADPTTRVIIPIPDKDLAFIMFSASHFPTVIPLPQIVEQGVTKNAGLDIGWCGFPSMALSELCFFHGFISKPYKHGYLVDGVVINGVSGGPAFYIQDNQPRICGVITEYLPNYATGQTLPGLGFISSVEPYHQTISELNTFDDAEREAETQREASLSASASPSQESPEQI